MAGTGSNLARRLGLAALAAIALQCQAADAQSFKVLHDFGSGQDGQGPVGALVLGSARLFGMTGGGGTNGVGTLFSLGRATGERVVYNFTNGQDGGIPYAGPIAVGGLLYGTTQIGGTFGNGTVFSIDPVSGKQTTIHAFAGGSDGGSPLAGLAYHDGTLYGTTFLDGVGNNGTIFSIDIASGKETTLYGFTGRADGGSPIGRLLYKDNFLFGTTEIGGASGVGTVFAFNLATKVEKPLYSFTGQSDGGIPEAGVIAVGGYLYGTASNGGAFGDGTVFRIEPKTGVEKTVLAFNGSNGASPLAELVSGGSMLYGTAAFGGSASDGTIFALNLTTGAETTLYNFVDGIDGEYPQGGLLLKGGVLYGVSAYGGPYGEGAAFSLVLPKQ